MSKDKPTTKELADIQQPISKDGYTNSYFNKLYGKDKNPYTGTDRDRSNKSTSKFFSIPDELWKKLHKKKSK